VTPFTLYLLRHGAPIRPGLLLGHRDDEVTPAGIAACTVRTFDVAVDAIVTSDLRRARRCADAIGASVCDPRWREIDFGDWDGCAPADVDPATFARFATDPDASPPPGGERWSTLVARVGAAIDALLPRPTLVVTHGGPMRAALAHLCGMSPAASAAIHLPYAALLTLSVWPGEPRRAMLTGLAA